MNELLDDKRIFYISSYAVSPSRLFADAKQRIAIYLSIPAKQQDIKTTNYMKWHNKYRKHLFKTIRYSPTIVDFKKISTVPKIKESIELDIIQKMLAEKPILSFLSRQSNKNVVYYHGAPEYWTRANDYIPYFWNERDGERLSDAMSKLYTRNECVASLCALINSSLFYWWFVIMSDCRNLNKREIENFPLNLEMLHNTYPTKLTSLVAKVMANYRHNAIRKHTVYRTTGQVTYDEFHSRPAKSIMNEIDKVIARHYNFSEEELDYIINYDYKYRMGGAE